MFQTGVLRHADLTPQCSCLAGVQSNIELVWGYRVHSHLVVALRLAGSPVTNRSRCGRKAVLTTQALRCVQDWWGNTPLHLLLTCNAAAFAKETPPAPLVPRLAQALVCLLRAGARLDIQNVRGELPTQVAAPFAQEALTQAQAVVAGTLPLQLSDASALSGARSGASGADSMEQFAMVAAADSMGVAAAAACGAPEIAAAAGTAQDGALGAKQEGMQDADAAHGAAESSPVALEDGVAACDGRTVTCAAGPPPAEGLGVGSAMLPSTGAAPQLDAAGSLADATMDQQVRGGIVAAVPDEGEAAVADGIDGSGAPTADVHAEGTEVDTVGSAGEAAAPPAANGVDRE